MAISLLFVNRFGRSLHFCHVEFDKEAISDGCRSKKVRYQFLILSEFREPSLCGSFLQEFRNTIFDLWIMYI